MAKKVLIITIFFVIIAGSGALYAQTLSSAMSDLERAVASYERLVNQIIRNNTIDDATEREARNLQMQVERADAAIKNRNFEGDWTDALRRRYNDAVTKLEVCMTRLNGWSRNN